MRFVLSASIFGVITFVSVTEAQINHTDASRNPAFRETEIDWRPRIKAGPPKLGTNSTANGCSRDSYVVQLTLLPPNKTSTAPFFEGHGSEPVRYARATVSVGATNTTDMYWQEYIVGPLPVTTSTTIDTLTYPFHNSIPGRTKAHSLYRPSSFDSFQSKLGSEIQDITRALWNSTILEGRIGVRVGDPFWDEEGRAIAWASFFSAPTVNISIATVLPLGVAVRLDLTSGNWEDWKATSWYSRGKSYSSTQAFRNAVFSPSFVKPPPNVEGDWSSTDRQGDSLPLDDLPPPSTSQRSQRFRIDEKEDYVSWMDFSFYHSVSSDIGLSLFDIQYKGKRILYELSLQEAITHYTGSDPYASQTTFFDTSVGMGSSLVPLVRGYDCPSYATYLNAKFSEGNSTKTQNDAICLFEFDAGYPIRRHSFQPSSPYTSVAKNVAFTVRTISTLGNYDFLIDRNFFYDGAIEVSARASGYISATYWEDSPEYGFHIHDYLSGSLHDHVLTFKADFDILGTQNSVQRIEYVPESTAYPWSNGKIHSTFKATRGFVASENDASIDWAVNDAVVYAVVNKDTPNRFGESPGYRIKRSAGTSHLTATNATNMRKAAAFATHDLYVTKQKDTEPRAADVANRYATDDPLVDFAKFLDGDSLDQEDLVVWFNLGMHHMPHTGDLPNTMYTAAHSAMRLEPINYLNGDPSVASNQQVRIRYNDDGSVADVEEFGKKTT